NLAGAPHARAYRFFYRLGGWYPPYLTPRSHIQWRQRGEFALVFPRLTFRAYNLLTPLLLVAQRLRRLIFRRRPGAGYIRAEEAVYQFLERRIDTPLVRRFPIFANYCWTIIICATKE